MSLTKLLRSIKVALSHHFVEVNNGILCSKYYIGISKPWTAMLDARGDKLFVGDKVIYNGSPYTILMKDYNTFFLYSAGRRIKLNARIASNCRLAYFRTLALSTYFIIKSFRMEIKRSRRGIS